LDAGDVDAALAKCDLEFTLDGERIRISIASALWTHG